MDQVASLFKTNSGEIGILIQGIIPASMKKTTYFTKVAVTKNSLVACECQCAAGSTKLDKGVCVHNLPLIMLLSFLLHDGLAEHMLVEIGNRWNLPLEEELKQKDIEKYNKVVNAIDILLETAGIQHQYNEEDQTIIKKLLSIQVGTEVVCKKYKNKVARDDELIPLSEIRIQYNKYLFEERIRLAKKQNNSKTNPSNDMNGEWIQNTETQDNRNNTTNPSNDKEADSIDATILKKVPIQHY